MLCSVLRQEVTDVSDECITSILTSQSMTSASSKIFRIIEGRNTVSSCRISRSHNDRYEEYCILGSNVLNFCRSSATFLPPSSGSKSKQRNTCFLRLLFELIRSAEISVHDLISQQIVLLIQNRLLFSDIRSAE
jgi:hypothetical protein